MGAGASVATDVSQNSEGRIKVIDLKKLPDAIEEAVYVHEKFPLIIDPSEQAGRFLKYQTGTFTSFDDPIQSRAENVNKALVGALQYGRTFTLKFKTLEGVNESIFTPNLFPKEVLSRQQFFTDDIWTTVIPKPKSEDEEQITISPQFIFIICTNTEYIPPQLFDVMHVIKVVEKAPNGSGNGVSGANTGNKDDEDPMEQIAAMFGAKEVIR